MTRDDFDVRVKRGDVTVFRYAPNNRGFIFLQICAGLLFIIGYMVYLTTAFEPRYWAILSIVLVCAGLFLIYLVIRWSGFARASAVAFDEGFLYIVRKKSVDQIPWADITADSAGFGESHDDGDHGTLNVRIGGQRVELTLFNPFVWVDDFPTFLVELLSQIKRNSQPGGPTDAVDDSSLPEDTSNADDDALDDEANEPAENEPGNA